MPNNVNTLKEIANSKPKKQPKKKEPTSKELRAEEIQALGDWLIWIEIAKEQSEKKWLNRAEYKSMYEGIKQEFTEISLNQEAMSVVMIKYMQLMTHEKYLNHALSEIYKKVRELEKLEKLINKGGRPPKNKKEIYEIAYAECLAWFLKTGKKPSGSKLSKLVEAAMKLKKGEARIDGVLFLTDRRARSFLSQWQPPNVKFNRQELVKFFSN